MDKLKDFILKLSEDTKKEMEDLERKEDTMQVYDFVREMARKNGSLGTLNKILLFMLENKI